jgi:hypothetical protein
MCKPEGKNQYMCKPEGKKILYWKTINSKYSGTCLIWHTQGPGKCVGLYRMSEYSGFILVNRNALGSHIFVWCHRMSENSGVGLHKIHFVSCLNCTFIHNIFCPVSHLSYLLDEECFSKIQWNLSKLNIHRTNFCIRNRQVFSLYRLN